MSSKCKSGWLPILYFTCTTLFLTSILRTSGVTLDSSARVCVSYAYLHVHLCSFAGFTVIQIIGIVLCGTMISIMSLFFANHLITNPSAKTRKKIEKLEMQLEAGEQGASRRVGARRAQTSTRVIRTQPGLSKQGSVPRRIWPLHSNILFTTTNDFEYLCNARSLLPPSTL